MIKTSLRIISALAASNVLAAVAFAQSPPAMDHSKMDHSKMETMAPAVGTAADTAATKAFMAANDRMHGDMAITYSGNTDVDFIKGMMPHHQGAIDMAKIELEYGKDPKARKLARKIIKAQNTEIAFMKAWLAKKAK